MITKYVSNINGELYEAFFRKVNEALSKENHTININSLEEYFNHMETIKGLHNAAQFLTLPLDEPLFEIDANSRNIMVPNEFKRNGVGVVGDSMAESLFFIIDRYFDIQDLSQQNDVYTYIQWATPAPNAIKGYSIPWLTDIDSVPGKYIFAWAIPALLTKNPGNLKFSVRFQQKDTTGAIVYDFSTLPQTIKINGGINYDLSNEAVIQKDETKLETITKRLRNSSIGSIHIPTPKFYVCSPEIITTAEIFTTKDPTRELKVSAYPPNGANHTSIIYTLSKDLVKIGDLEITRADFGGEAKTQEVAVLNAVYKDSADESAITGKVYYKEESSGKFIPLTSEELTKAFGKDATIKPKERVDYDMKIAFEEVSTNSPLNFEKQYYKLTNEGKYAIVATEDLKAENRPTPLYELIATILAKASGRYHVSVIAKYEGIDDSRPPVYVEVDTKDNKTPEAGVTYYTKGANGEYTKFTGDSFAANTVYYIAVAAEVTASSATIHHEWEFERPDNTNDIYGFEVKAGGSANFNPGDGDDSSQAILTVTVPKDTAAGAADQQNGATYSAQLYKTTSANDLKNGTPSGAAKIITPTNNTNYSADFNGIRDMAYYYVTISKSLNKETTNAITVGKTILVAETLGGLQVSPKMPNDNVIVPVNTNLICEYVTTDPKGYQIIATPFWYKYKGSGEPAANSKPVTNNVFDNLWTQVQKQDEKPIIQTVDKTQTTAYTASESGYYSCVIKTERNGEIQYAASNAFTVYRIN